ncbi:MAG: 2OG-Fe(II) oxygenase, partial [Pseudomonadales bacterium]
PYLAPIANQWMHVLNMETRYPEDHETFLATCHSQGQQQPTPLILKYGKGGYNTLHQDLYGSVYFPLQLVLFLSDYGTAYEGGEFVITEQVPRSQSKARVIKPQKGDALLLATSFRPVKGTRGYYRTNLRHGVSEVTSGNRYTMGIIFHDATN